MKRVLLVMMAGAVALRGAAAAQLGEPPISVESVQTRPDPPRFGEVFDLVVTLRIPRGTLLYLPDTLNTAASAESTGQGSWRFVGSAGDSTEVEAIYPVIGYLEGRLDLPSIELAYRVGAPIDSLSAVRSLAESMGVEEADTAVVRLGAVTVPKLAAMEDSAAVLVLRPPMDVVGGNWSVWLLLAGGITVLAVVGGIGWVAPRTMRQRSPRPGGALSARAAALHELERIRRAGGHRDGRVDEFYAATTDVLRRFAAHVDPAWPTSLTSSELLERLQAGSVGPDLDGAGDAVRRAERVKFGGHRPEAEAAEADWEAIRRWIASAPDR